MKTQPIFLLLLCIISYHVQAETLYLPHFTFNQDWQTQVALSNPTSHAATASITAYSQSGNEVAHDTVTIGALSTLRSSIQEIFPQLEPQNGWLRIETPDDVVLSGSMQFTALAQGGTSTLPLDGKTGTRLILPAVLEANAWHGGFAIVNTSAKANDIHLEVYTPDGRQVAGHKTQLRGHAKWVHMLNAIGTFDDLAASNTVVISSSEPITAFALNFGPGTRQIVAVPATIVPGQAPQQITDLTTLEGDWRRLGYDQYIRIENQILTLYDSPDGSCSDIDSVIDLTDLPAEYFDVTRMADGRVRWLLSTGEVMFFELAKDPIPTQGCTQSSDVFTNFDRFWQIFEKHYAFFETRNLNWHDLGDQYRGQLNPSSTSADLAEVLGNLIYEIDDPHVSLDAGIFGDYDSQNPRRYQSEIRQRFADQDDVADFENYRTLELNQSVSNLLGYLDNQPILALGNGQIIVGRVNGQQNIGYLNVFQMHSLGEEALDLESDLAALPAALDEAFEYLQGVDKIILDVRLNPGGFDLVSQAIAARIVDQPRLAYSKAARDGDHLTPFRSIWLEPHTGNARFTGDQIVLLTSELTTSGAEIFTLLMRADPRTVHIGDPTAGALSDVLSKTLPNGWVVDLSNEVYLDHEGQLWEGPGIAPDIAVPHASLQDLIEERDSVLEEAIKQLK